MSCAEETCPCPSDCENRGMPSDPEKLGVFLTADTFYVRYKDGTQWMRVSPDDVCAIHDIDGTITGYLIKKEED